MNINEVEPKLAQKLGDPLREILQDLSYPLPDNYQPLVSLWDANGRKKRSNSAASNWSPESGGRLEIRFEPVLPAKQQPGPEISRKDRTASHALHAVTLAGNSCIHPSEAELLRVLDRAESSPGLNFVPLKKFLDE